MRNLFFAWMVLVAACGRGSEAGCPPGSDVCGDGPVCADGSPGPDCPDDPDPACPDGRLGCDDVPTPPCEFGERRPCTCADGAAGEVACGETACMCGPPRCSLRHAGRLDFGSVPPGQAETLALELVNEGNTACELTGFWPEGCPAELSVDAVLSVPARSSTRLPVTFRAAGEGTFACSLLFDVNAPEHARNIVALSGRSDPGCLAVEPAALDFGAIEAGCGTHEAELTVANRCAVPVRLDTLSLDGPEFLLLAAPPVPADLRPGTTMPLAIGYRPDEPGSHAGALRVGLSGLPPIAVSLAGTAGEGAPITDRFQNGERPKVDLLFVIDNGSSMANDQVALGNNLRPFLSWVHTQDVDYHLGVTTTGLAPGGDCPGGVGGGEDGRLFPVDGSRVRMITPDTPDLEAVWAANVQVGACRTGPNPVFEAALRAVTSPVADAVDDPRHPEPNDGNAGFLRPDAHLSVIAITDRADTSPNEPNYYYNAFLALKGFRNTHLFNFHAITGNRDSGCVRGDVTAEAGDRLIDLVEKTEGGVFGSICAPDWENALRDYGSAAAYSGFGNCYFLTQVPKDLDGDGSIGDTDGELEVRIDGTVVPSRGAQGQQLWTYAEDRNAVCFNALAVPDPGSTIEVDYVPVCLP